MDFCVAHLGELIRVYLSEATDIAGILDCSWHWEDEPLGTAGALTTIPDLDGTFLVMNGDILTTLDFSELLDAHHRSGAILTIAMHQKRVNIDLGVIESDGQFITGYTEKPTLFYDVSMGIYVYEKAALKYLPGGVCQFPDLVKRLIAAGERVARLPKRRRMVRHRHLSGIRTRRPIHRGKSRRRSPHDETLPRLAQVLVTGRGRVNRLCPPSDRV